MEENKKGKGSQEKGEEIDKAKQGAGLVRAHLAPRP